MGRKTTTTRPSSLRGSMWAKMTSSSPSLPMYVHTGPKWLEVIFLPLLMLLTNMNYALAIVSILLDVTYC